MNRALLLALALGLLVAAIPVAAPVAAQDRPAGARGEVLGYLADAEQKLISLAEAIPAEKYTWRPAEGVRSVSELFLHMVAASYAIPRQWGYAPPEDFAPQGFERSTTDKAEVVEHLRKAFAHCRSAVMAVADADLDKPMRMFGNETTQRGALILLAGHAREHLGQAIAYARVNGVVPPWTAARQAQPQQQQQRPPQ
jgi:uncharacterized damage-inducible protein DinB